MDLHALQHLVPGLRLHHGRIRAEAHRVRGLAVLGLVLELEKRSGKRFWPFNGECERP